MKVVVKVGGAAIEEKSTLHKCAHAIVELARDGHHITVVHGGGGALTRTLKLLGKESDFVNGLRITELGLGMKSEIEKVREQVQNIE